MRLFLDSSAFAKRFIEEAGSDRVASLCDKASSLGLSVLCVPEIVSALNRRRREGDLPPRRYAQVKQQLLDEIRDADIIQLTPAVVECAIALLERNTLRASDALHVACAVQWEAETFASADKQQLRAATRAGLNALPA